MTSKNEFNSGYNNTLFIRDWSLKKRGFDDLHNNLHRNFWPHYTAKNTLMQTEIRKGKPGYSSQDPAVYW
jgi:hypothetical protein